MSSGDLQCTTYGIILFRQGNRIDILSGGIPTLFCELSKAQAKAGHHEAALTFLYKKKGKVFPIFDKRTLSAKWFTHPSTHVL